MKKKIVVSAAAILIAGMFGWAFFPGYAAESPPMGPGEAMTDLEAFAATWSGGRFLAKTPAAIAASDLPDGEKIGYLLDLLVVAPAARFNATEFLSSLSAKEFELAMATVDLVATDLEVVAQAALDEAKKIKRPVAAPE